MKRSAIRTGSHGVVARGLLAAWVLGGCGDDRVPSGSGGTESTAATDGSGSTAASTHETSSTGTTEADSSTVAEEGSSTGIPSPCGNGVLDPGEQCDDGNTKPGDGCNEHCEVTTQTAVRVETGGRCTCAILSEGRLRCWGRSMCNGYGDYYPGGDIGDDEVPAEVGDVPTDVPIAAISVGMPSCAVAVNGVVRCWGSYWGNEYGTIGLGTSPDAGAPKTFIESVDLEIGGPAIDVRTSGMHTCAILATGDLVCWGWNEFGQLGYGHTENLGDDEVPALAGPVPLGGEIPARVVQVQLGQLHTCALLEGGNVKCWGVGQHPDSSAMAGLHGYGHVENLGDDETPADYGPVALGGPAVKLAGGSFHTCALLEGGDVLCWGQGGGTLGYGNFETIGDDEVPADVGPIQLGEPATDITGNCAILEGGRVKCWSATDGTLPYQAPEIEIGGPVLQLSQSTHFCALLPDHAIRCFGRNQNGCLGYGNTFSDCLSDCDDEPPECCVGYHGPPADAGNVPYE